jgi:hypothetical protein
MAEQIITQEGINDQVFQMFDDLHGCLISSRMFFEHQDEFNSKTIEIKWEFASSQYITLWFSGRGGMIQYCCEETFEDKKITTRVSFNKKIATLEIKQKTEIKSDSNHTIINDNWEILEYKGQDILDGIEKAKEVFSLQTGF